MLLGRDCYIAVSTELAQRCWEKVQAATEMQQNWEEGSQVWQNVSKGMERLKWKGILTVNKFREKILEREDSYCLQILEMEILTMRRDDLLLFFLFFLIEKSVCRKNEAGKNAPETVKGVGL